MSGVTVKTLRHYDEIGLLKPAQVDEESGYRYYTAEQLLTIRRIAGFKEQGLTLEMIRPLLNGPVSLTQAESTLLEKRKELEQKIDEARRQLADIDKRLGQISNHNAGERGFSLRRVEPVLIASVREELPKGQICLLLDELKKYLTLRGLEPYHETTIIWHRKADCNDEPSDIEVAFPIPKPFPESGRVKIRQLSGIDLAASYIHECNPYQDECKASEVLRGWIMGHGYRALDTIPVREIYLTSDKDIYGQLRMAEVIIPVERV